MGWAANQRPQSPNPIVSQREVVGARAKSRPAAADEQGDKCCRHQIVQPGCKLRAGMLRAARASEPVRSPLAFKASRASCPCQDDGRSGGPERILALPVPTAPNTVSPFLPRHSLFHMDFFPLELTFIDTLITLSIMDNNTGPFISEMLLRSDLSTRYYGKSMSGLLRHPGPMSCHFAGSV